MSYWKKHDLQSSLVIAVLGALRQPMPPATSSGACYVEGHWTVDQPIAKRSVSAYTNWAAKGHLAKTKMWLEAERVFFFTAYLVFVRLCPGKLRWQWNTTSFNRRYVFIRGCVSIVILVFGGVSQLCPRATFAIVIAGGMLNGLMTI